MQYTNLLTIGLMGLGNTHALPERSPEPTAKASLPENQSETMTWIMDSSTYTMACYSDAKEFEDCTEIQAKPVVTAKAVLHSPMAKRSYTRTDGDCTKTCEHKWNCLKNLDPDCYLDNKAEAAKQHSTFTITMMAGQNTATVACRDDAEDFDQCHTLTDAPNTATFAYSTLTDAPSTTMKPVLPDLAKRSFTTSHDGCTAVCKNELLEGCQIHCSPQQVGLAARGGLGDEPGRDWVTTETVSGIAQTLDCTVHGGDNNGDTQSYCIDHYYATKTHEGPGPHSNHPLHRRDIVTVTNGGCTAVCWTNEPSPACDIQCSGGFAAQVALPTPKPLSEPILKQRDITTTITTDGFTAVCWGEPGENCDIEFSFDFALPTSQPLSKPMLQQRGLTTTHDGCTAVCWDQSPGTGCDILCHDSSITKMPEPTSGVSSLWKTTFTSFDCTFICQDLYPGSECGVQCPGQLPTGAFAHAKAALAAPTDAIRKDLQARQAQEARLDRKFGLGARGDPLKAVSEAAFALSEASVALAEAVPTSTPKVVLPSAASAALSEAASFLLPVSQSTTPTTVSATLTGTAPLTLSSGGTASILFPVSTGNETIPSSILKTKTPWWSSLLASTTPTKTSALTSIMTVNGSSTTFTTLSPETVTKIDSDSPVYTGGASYEGQSVVGFLFLMLAGIIGSMVLMI